MAYLRRVPPAPLNTYIDDLYTIEGAAPHTRFKVFPMPSLHLMVNLGVPFVVRATENSAALATYTESWGIGLWSRSYVVEWAREVRFYGIHFKPGGAYPFLQMPLSKLHNEIVPLDAIWGSFAAEIRERLYDAPTAKAGLALFERLLLMRLCEAPHSLRMVQGAITEIERQHGTLSIRGLSEYIGASQSHLDTQFKRIVGISPKELARFYRFAQVLRAVNPTQSVDWTWLAHQACFYDQAHFNHEFSAFTGYSPTDYLQQRRRLVAAHLDQPQTLGQLPID